MPTNNILPFCETDTGTNLPTQGDYAIDPNREIGNSPGVASSKLNNKPIRQATFITSQLAQMVSDLTGADVLDDGNTTKLLAIMNAALKPLQPVFSSYLVAGAATHYATYYFFIASGNATAAATYTNNTFTFTVVTTIASGTLLRATGTGVPAVSGTLTKASGTGDATLTFYAFRKPLYTKFRAVGGGGGGGGDPSEVAAGGGGGAGAYSEKLDNAPSASYAIVIGARGSAGVAAGASGGNGGDTTVAGITAGGGVGAASTGPGAAGGTASGGDINIKGGAGNGGDTGDDGVTNGAGGSGGSSYFGSNGGGGYSSAGTTAEYGGGGGGGSNNANGGQGGLGAVFIDESF